MATRVLSSLDTYIDIVDHYLAPEDEIDGEEVLRRRAVVGRSQHLGPSIDRDDDVVLVAGDLDRRCEVARQAGPDHPDIDTVRTFHDHRLLVHGLIEVWQHFVVVRREQELVVRDKTININEFGVGILGGTVVVVLARGD